LQQLEDLIELFDLEARKVLLQGLDLFFGLNIGIVVSIRLRPVTGRLPFWLIIMKGARSLKRER
jgi:hypothetical protein